MLSALLLICAAWLLWAALAHALVRNPRREPLAGLTLIFLRLYARLFHRLRIDGRENIPRAMHPGPLVVVANHTAGVDPVLVQAAVPFEIRWMMGRDMMPARLDELWAFTGVIPVNRNGADTTAARSAMRHLADGGVIGIYPEGGIERPPRTVLPFQPGVGLLIKRSGAPVLQVIIDGTPNTPTAWGSLFRRSSRGARLRFLPLRDYRAPDLAHLSAAEIAEDLRDRLIRETCWPHTRQRSAETQR
ncbi:MAG: lysophospholipid acyltransferase family protein [Phycisphaerales bacterium]